MAEITLTVQNFEEEVLKSDIPVVVDFWATWCGPCRMLAPVIAKIAEKYDGKIKVGKVNVDDEAELAMKYDVAAIPTVLRIEGGDVVEKSMGFMPQDQLEEALGLDTL